MNPLFNIPNKPFLIKRNDFLCQKGHVDNNIYFIKSGSVIIYIITDEGEEQIIRFGYKNNFIVALDSFFTQQPTVLFIQAIKRTEGFAISKSDFENYILESQENKTLKDEMLQSLIIQQFEREIDLLIDSPKKRYEKILKRSPQLFQEVPQKFIANYLRMTLETLSRLNKS